VYLATKNAGKREEFAALFAGTPIALRTYDDYRDPIEGEHSYTDNAALKANALREQLLAAGIVADVLADDSGLEVDALAGRPGVITADYGGAGLTWAERRRVVLDELAALGDVDRSARFVCYLHFIAADGEVVTAFGDFAGRIASEDRGASGFSFDPIFAYGPDGRTFAELSSEEKNSVSHRARAVAQLLQRIG
jgi:XTP/dITP diphosphohydrolase